jgi:hypothetical protein
MPHLKLANGVRIAGSIDVRGVPVSTVEFDETSSELGEPGAAKVETAEVAAARPQAAAPTKQIYTMLAREGVNAAELINTAMRKRPIGKAVPRHVQVIAPHGPSTAGGKKARQSITLAQVAGGGPAIMVGHLDVAQKAAELREFGAVAKQYRARFGSALEVSVEEYQGLLKELSTLLSTMGFQLTNQLEEEEEAVSASELPGARRELTPKLLVLAAGAVVVAALAAFSLLR